VAVAIDFERCLSNRRQIAAEAFAENKIRGAKTLFWRVGYLSRRIEASTLAVWVRVYFPHIISGLVRTEVTELARE